MKDLPLLFLCLVIFAGFHGLRFYQSDIDASLTRPVHAGTDSHARQVPPFRERQQSWRIQGRYASMRRSPRAPTPPAQETSQAWGFEYLDRNNDGYLSRRDASRDPMLLKHWEALDRNNDDYLQPLEYAYF